MLGRFVDIFSLPVILSDEFIDRVVWTINGWKLIQPIVEGFHEAPTL